MFLTVRLCHEKMENFLGRCTATFVKNKINSQPWRSAHPRSKEKRQGLLRAAMHFQFPGAVLIEKSIGGSTRFR